MMRQISKITSKGQITLPIAIRRLLALKEGDRVLFEVDESGNVRMRPEGREGRFAKYRGVGVGHLKTQQQADEWLKTLRGRKE